MIDVRRLVAPPTPAPAVRKSRRQGLAVAGSLAAHIAIFFGVFAAASGSVVSASGSAGGPDGPVFTVTLVTLPSNSSAGRAGGPKILNAKLSAPTPDAVLATAGSPSPGLQGLFETLRSQQVRTPSPHLQASAMPKGARSPADAPASESPRPQSDRKSDADGTAAGSESTGGALWGAIEPCWRNLGAGGRVPVVLEIALNGRGDLRSPPKIVRDPAAVLNEPRLQSEATALAAVAACAPKGDLRLSNRTFRVEFPATP